MQHEAQGLMCASRESGRAHFLAGEVERKICECHCFLVRRCTTLGQRLNRGQDVLNSFCQSLCSQRGTGQSYRD